MGKLPPGRKEPTSVLVGSQYKNELANLKQAACDSEDRNLMEDLVDDLSIEGLGRSTRTE